MFLIEVVCLQLNVSHSNRTETGEFQPEISHDFHKLLHVKSLSRQINSEARLERLSLPQYMEKVVMFLYSFSI